MRFLVDECLYVQIVDRLRALGHDVVWVRDGFSGSTDRQLLHKAMLEASVLISEDRDFGELIYRDGCAAYGVILAKVAEFNGTLQDVAREISGVIDGLGQLCIGQFTVIEPGKVRQRALPTTP